MENFVHEMDNYHSSSLLTYAAVFTYSLIMIIGFSSWIDLKFRFFLIGMCIVGLVIVSMIGRNHLAKKFANTLCLDATIDKGILGLESVLFTKLVSHDIPKLDLEKTLGKLGALKYYDNKANFENIRGYQLSDTKGHSMILLTRRNISETTQTEKIFTGFGDIKTNIIHDDLRYVGDVNGTQVFISILPSTDKTMKAIPNIDDENLAYEMQKETLLRIIEEGRKREASMYLPSPIPEVIEPQEPVIEERHGEMIGKCMVCNLPIYEDQPIRECENCKNIAHRAHLAEWIHVKGNCPICGIEMR